MNPFERDWSKEEAKAADEVAADEFVSATIKANLHRSVELHNTAVLADAEELARLAKEDKPAARMAGAQILSVSDPAWQEAERKAANNRCSCGALNGDYHAKDCTELRKARYDAAQTETDNKHWSIVGQLSALSKSVALLTEEVARLRKPYAYEIQSNDCGRVRVDFATLEELHEFMEWQGVKFPSPNV